MFLRWINKLLSEENKIPEHCQRLDRWQGPPHINTEKQRQSQFVYSVMKTDLFPLIKISSPELHTAPLTTFNIRSFNAVLLLHSAPLLVCFRYLCVVLWFVLCVFMAAWGTCVFSLTVTFAALLIGSVLLLKYTHKREERRRKHTLLHEMSAVLLFSLHITSDSHFVLSQSYLEATCFNHWETWQMFEMAQTDTVDNF